jgi:hypothetical protein
VDRYGSKIRDRSTINYQPSSSRGGPLSFLFDPIIPARISVVTIRLIFALRFGDQLRFL